MKPLVWMLALFGASPAFARPDRTLIARGEYLVKAAGCYECHTPMVFDKTLGIPVPDLRRALSGHPEHAPDPASTLAPGDQGVIGPTFTAFKLPFGVVYAVNLTPDKATGIGNWTVDLFVKAIRTGRHMGGTGRPILPPMPWRSLSNLSDRDLRAIFAYLQSLPPIRNEVPRDKVSDAALAQIAAAYDQAKKAARRPLSGR